LLSYILVFLIFLPFFRVMEKQELAEEAKIENLQS
jgi:cellobiose-specific phosphotransferase system component IIC